MSPEKWNIEERSRRDGVQYRALRRYLRRIWRGPWRVSRDEALRDVNPPPPPPDATLEEIPWDDAPSEPLPRVPRHRKEYVFHEASDIEMWRINWHGQVCTPRFDSVNAALERLDMYQRGAIEPEL